jgi:hypothetical protein
LNLAPDNDALAFRIENNALVWEEKPVPTDEARAVQSAERESKVARDTSRLGEAIRFLRETLAGGSRPARAVLTEARECGLARMTVQRARESMGIAVKKESGPNGCWTWSLPEPAPPEVPEVSKGQADAGNG